MTTAQYVVLYDRDCGICSALSRWLLALDVARRIRLQPIQSSRDLLRDVPEARRLDAFHVVSIDGAVATGGDAVAVLLEALPGGAGLGRVVRASNRLMAFVHSLYRFLTRFRARLVCRREPAATSVGSDP